MIQGGDPRLGDWGETPLHGGQPAALLIADAGASAMEAAILAAGGRVAGLAGWPDAVERLRFPGAVSVLAVDCAGADDASLALALPHLQAVSDAHGTPIVATFDLVQIDVVTANLHGSHVELLCVPSLLDRTAALTLALLRGAGTQLHEATRDADGSQLRRLNEEIARIAETLARLSRPDVREPVIERKTDLVAPAGAEPAAVAARDVRAAIRVRRLRDQFFEAGLFEDPAWDILLDLFAAELERAQVSVSSLCIASAVAPTTALRWIAKMTEAGLLIRQPDPFDRRRAFMGLSPSAFEAMRRYFGAASRAGSSIA